MFRCASPIVVPEYGSRSHLPGVMACPTAPTEVCMHIWFTCLSTGDARRNRDLLVTTLEAWACGNHRKLARMDRRVAISPA